MDRSHMGKIERGERNVTLLNLVKIARALLPPLRFAGCCRTLSIVANTPAV
nr:helix-turn-helix transcriptional regulator [Burkholderia stagnalis]